MVRTNARICCVCLFAICALSAGPSFAAESTKNSTGSNWSGSVKPVGTTGQEFTAEQVATIRTVNDYFNSVQNMAGRFHQTNPDKKLQKGKFFLQRPGRFRFDYNRPSRQVIVSDGTYLAIQDHDLKNEDVYTLENTPFKILLRDDVDLLRDAKILAVERSETQIAVAIADKNPDSTGQITVYLAVSPKVELAGWVTTDVQGGVTRVEVGNLTRPDKLDRKLFNRGMISRGTTQ